jgi:hypothetical protein
MWAAGPVEPRQQSVGNFRHWKANLRRLTVNPADSGSLATSGDVSTSSRALMTCALPYGDELGHQFKGV